MSITAISGLTAEKYIPEIDKDSDEPTSFKLKPLSGVHYMSIMAEVTELGDGESRITGNGLRLAIKHGLVGWDNFNDAQGNKMKFNPVNVKKIPPAILTELAGEIISRSEVGGEQIKNS